MGTRRFQVDFSDPELRDMHRRDHEWSIAILQARADQAAKDGDEEKRALWQRMADNKRAAKLPWETDQALGEEADGTWPGRLAWRQ